MPQLGAAAQRQRPDRAEFAPLRWRPATGMANFAKTHAGQKNALNIRLQRVWPPIRPVRKWAAYGTTIKSVI